jgi:hypothetical protein
MNMEKIKKRVFQLNKSLVTTLPKTVFKKGDTVIQIPTEEGLLLKKVEDNE